MREQTEEASLIVTLLNHHREEIAKVWAEMVRRLPDSHYSERPLEELHASTLHAVEVIIEALSSHSYTPLETYLNDVSLTRLQMGFNISEVIEALLLCKDASLPIIWGSCSPGSPEVCEAIVQLDECLRHMIGCFGRLYAEAMNHSLQMEQRRIALLLDVAETANSSLDLDEVLTKTLDLVVALVGASRAGVILLDEHTGDLIPHTLRPERAIEPDNMAEMVQACQAVIASGETLYVAPDIDKGLFEPGALLPLHIRSKILGVLVIIGSKGGEFTQEQLILFKSIADQLGVALENTRLYDQAQELAVVEERSRLARDLHDAVTQTLFSTSLIAEVLPDIWEKDPDEGKQLLKEVRQLSRGALTEMRALLLELRPAALAEAKLGALLRQLAEAASGRTGVPITVAVEGECEIPSDVHIAIYRVAQEALNNIVKHAHASQAAINLRCSKASMNGEKSIVELNIHDDGRGFDMACVSPDHMGLRIMRERIEAIGAKLEIVSESDSGTQITVMWKEDKG